ncbi:MAG: ABC transporter ATP-binding protein [Lacibacter sp.]|nr:ABC transporter ATP-binding protein [Lacibacter sp.]
MQQNIHLEIPEHLRNKDYSLAVRRLLDLSYDTGDLSLMKEATRFSREWTSQLAQQQETEPAEAFFTNAELLLSKATDFLQHKEVASTKLLHAENISKQYSKGVFKLNPISLQISSGDIHGVVGENGNGKTTLLRCLSGQLLPDNGSINYSLLQKPDYYNIKNYVAFIPQRIPRWYGMLKDNLHFSAAIAGIHGETNTVMVEFMLERLSLSSYASLNWNQISSGYRTRFELARILLQKPQLLILDEPLANLDIKAQQTILTDLKYMTAWTNHPMAVILSSQQLHEVEKVADTVLMIRNGTCINHHTTTADYKPDSTIIEIETLTEREAIANALATVQTDIRFNGGFYTISSPDADAQQLIALLISNKIPVTYYRDITHSTKRFF